VTDKGWNTSDEIIACVFGFSFRWCPAPPARRDGKGKPWDAGPVCDWLVADTQEQLNTFDTLMSRNPLISDTRTGRIDRLLHARDVTGAKFGPEDHMTRALRERL
jgi:hypothetical protein